MIYHILLINNNYLIKYRRRRKLCKISCLRIFFVKVYNGLSKYNRLNNGNLINNLETLAIINQETIVSKFEMPSVQTTCNT